MTESPYSSPDYEFFGRFEDRARAYIAWILSMDDPNDPRGRAERQTVTLTQIIEYAKATHPDERDPA